MEVSFDVDIDLEEESNHSKEDYELHNDYDNQKLFDIYESYLNKADISDTETEPEISFSDQFHQLVTNRSDKTPIKNRPISCLADIESRTPRTLRKSLVNNDCNQSIEESFSDLSLPWNLNEMSDQQIIDLCNGLEEELFVKEMDGPKIAAKQTKAIYQKEIQFLKKMFDESENDFQNSLRKINIELEEQRLDFNDMIGQQMETIKSNSEELTKQVFQLNVIKEISDK